MWIMLIKLICGSNLVPKVLIDEGEQEQEYCLDLDQSI